MDTVLFNPPQEPVVIRVESPQKQPAPEQSKKAKTFEDQLENIGDKFHTFGCIVMVLCIAAAIPAIAFAVSDNGSVIPLISIIAVAISAYAQGVIIQAMFYSIAKALRLLMVIADDTKSLNNPVNK